MKITAEIIRHNEVDSQGDFFLPGALAGNEGREVPITVNFDPTRVVGKAILHLTDTGMSADFDSEAIDRSGFSPKAFALAAGLIADKYTMSEDSKQRRHEAIRLTEVAIVHPKNKVK